MCIRHSFREKSIDKLIYLFDRGYTGYATHFGYASNPSRHVTDSKPPFSIANCTPTTRMLTAVKCPISNLHFFNRKSVYLHITRIM